MEQTLQETESLSQLDTSALLAMAEKIAKERFDGHLTIFRFTTHWKVMFRTPDTYTGLKYSGPGIVDLDAGGSGEIKRLKPAKTLRGALLNLVSEHLQTEN